MNIAMSDFLAAAEKELERKNRCFQVLCSLEVEAVLLLQFVYLC